MSKASITLLEDDSDFLLSFADDTEESPWMVAADPQLLALLALVGPAQVYVANQRPDLYVSSELAIRFPKVNGKIGQVAPDMFVAYAPTRLRNSFDVIAEGGFPAFVLEVVSPESVRRDTRDKPRLYGLAGAREYVIFDPLGDDGQQLSGYHRDAQGDWVRWPGGKRRVLVSQVLGLTLEVHGMLLRLRDQSGQLLPTLQEVHDARAADARRAEAERQRADAHIRSLEAELARLRQDT